MSDDEMEEELGIKAGTTIDTNKAVYVIDRMLGEEKVGLVLFFLFMMKRIKKHSML
jgi:hypothetical protein